jgi:hypothetical protein
MSEFVYLYRGDKRPVGPENTQKVMQKWMTWMKELGDKGHLKDPGHPLEQSGAVVNGKQKPVTDGPFAEAKDMVGGFTLIDAKDLNQAIELTRGCPIFDQGGVVEVRPIAKM